MRLLTIKEVQLMQLALMKELHNYLENKKIPYYLLAGSALGAVRHNGFIPWDDDIDIGLFRKDYERFLQVCGDFDKQYEVVNYKNSDNCDFCLTRIYFNNTLIDNKSLEKTKLDKRLYFDIFPLDNVPDNEEHREAFEKKVKMLKKLIAFIDIKIYKKTGVSIWVKKLISKVLSPFRNSILGYYDKLIQKYSKESTNYICSICSQYPFSKQAMPKEYYGQPTLHCFETEEFYIPERINDYLAHLYGNDYMVVPPENKRRKNFDIYLLNKE